MIRSEDALKVAALLEKAAEEAPDVDVSDGDRAAGMVVAFETLKHLTKEGRQGGGAPMTGGAPSATPPTMPSSTGMMRGAIGMSSGGGAPAAATTPPPQPMTQSTTASASKIHGSKAITAPLSTNAVQTQLGKMGEDKTALFGPSGRIGQWIIGKGKALQQAGREAAEEGVERAATKFESASREAQRWGGKSKKKLVEEGAEQAATGLTAGQKAGLGVAGGAGGVYALSNREPEIKVQKLAEHLGFMRSLGVEDDLEKDAGLWGSLGRGLIGAGKGVARGVAAGAKGVAAGARGVASAPKAFRAWKQRRAIMSFDPTKQAPSGIGAPMSVGGNVEKLKGARGAMGKTTSAPASQAVKAPAAPAAADAPAAAAADAADEGVFAQGLKKFKELPQSAQIGLPAGGAFLLGAGYSGRDQTVQKF